MKVDTAMTNREVFQLAPEYDGWGICEWNPVADLPARLSDQFHDYAATESSMKGVGKLRVCDSCQVRLARINGGGK